MKLSLPITILIAFVFELSANAQWQKTNFPGYGYVVAIAANGDNIFVGTVGNGDGAYLSQDEGSSWKQISNGIDYSEVYCFAFRGSDTYAGVGGSLRSGIFLSQDTGKTWTSVNDDFPPVYYRKVYSLVSNGDKLIASIDGEIYLSPDGGTKWSMMSNDDMESSKFIAEDLLINGPNIYTAGYLDDGFYTNKKVYMSTDTCKTWTLLSDNLPIDGITSMAAIGNKLLISGGDGVIISSDTGKTWVPSNSNQNEIFDVRALIVNESKIFAGTGVGISFSVDSGKNWILVDDEARYSTIYSLAVIGSYLYATIWYNDQTGEVWKRPLSDFDKYFGINDVRSNDALNIYPNPAKNKITVELNNAITKQYNNSLLTEISVENVLGQILMTKSIASVRTEIDLDGFSSGVYFIHLHSVVGDVIQKVVVN